MANLEFCDTHNMVAYLNKSEGSEGFHQIVDFLNHSHIRYALTENPTIYVSLIQQFWQTATASTLDSGEIQITATIDGKVKIITEASIRRHLKLEDSDVDLPKGTFFPSMEILDPYHPSLTFNFSKLIFDGMVKNLDSKTKFLMYPRFIQIFLNKHKRLLLPHTRTYIAPAHTQKLFSNMRRASKGYTGVDIPLFPTMLVQGLIVQGEGSTVLVESHHTPTGATSTSQPPLSSPSRIPTRQESEVPQPRSPTQTPAADEAASTGVDVRHGGAATTVSSLDAGQGSGNIDKTPTMPHDSPLPRVHTLGSDEGRMQHNELMDLVTKLSDKVVALETDLRQTKKVYGAAYTKLIKKVKKLERAAKSSQSRRRANIVVSDDEDDAEDSSKQGRKIDEIDQDPDITLVQHDAEIQGRHGQEMEFETEVYTAEDVSTAGAAVTTAGASISTASPPRVSTAEDISTAETLVYIRRSAAKDKGKAKMDESEPEQTKTKLQQRQERAGYEAVVRLQEQLDEEERKRIARVHEEASSFNIEEWEDIQATIEADEELAQRIQAEEREKYSEAEKARLLAELINQRKRYFAQQRAEERRNKPLTQAQQRTYMSNYIKHMGSHTLQQLKRLSFDELKNLFEATMRRVGAFVPMETEIKREVPELAAGSSKRDAEEELDQGSSKRQKTGENSEPAKESKEKEDDELSQEELQQLMIIVPEEGMNVEALQTKYPIIDWEIYTEDSRIQTMESGSRKVWGGDDELWKSQKHVHDITWRLYDTCGVHHVSTKDGINIYMLVEKEYPLSRGVLTQMLAAKLLVEQNNEMSRELLRKIFMMAERPRR
ncbi:hypothetical protein Tco_0212586 [Tanacetum coccineum]